MSLSLSLYLFDVLVAHSLFLPPPSLFLSRSSSDILEIVRLYLASRGAGLLPFTLAGIILVIILLHLRLPHQVRPVSSLVILIFWSLSIAFTSVKLATLNKLADVESRDGSEYLNSGELEEERSLWNHPLKKLFSDALVSISFPLSEDQQLDVGVYIGLYGIAWLVEVYRLFYVIAERKKVSAATSI